MRGKRGGGRGTYWNLPSPGTAGVRTSDAPLSCEAMHCAGGVGGCPNVGVSHSLLLRKPRRRPVHCLPWVGPHDVRAGRTVFEPIARRSRINYDSASQFIVSTLGAPPSVRQVGCRSFRLSSLRWTKIALAAYPPNWFWSLTGGGAPTPTSGGSDKRRRQQFPPPKPREPQAQSRKCIAIVK